jgi:four helix bundle protein
MFAADVGWKDVTKLMKDIRTRDLCSQLYDALGSIGANISEGYSRISGRDQARFYEYALGSARESRSRYFNARHLLGEHVVSHRFELLASIAKLLLVMVPDQRASRLREDATSYMESTTDLTNSAFFDASVPFD